MEALILQLAQLLTPIITDVIKHYRDTHGGALPTDADIHAELTANLAKYLGEGSAWDAAHPNA